MSDSLRPQGLQHARPSCPSPTPGDYSGSCPLSRWWIQPPHPLSSLLLPPSLFPSIRIFSYGSVLHIRWPKYWRFSFIISPSNEYSGLICFRIDWFDLLSFQVTLKSLLQHHNSKASILWCSIFFTVQLSHPYITVGKPLSLSVLLIYILLILEKKSFLHTTGNLLILPWTHFSIWWLVFFFVLGATYLLVRQP